jgi:fucose permease
MQLGPLFGYGGWMTVSNMVVPLMVSMERFVIGAVFPCAIRGACGLVGQAASAGTADLLSLALSMVVSIVLFVIASMFDNLTEKVVFVAVTLVCFTYIVWYDVLEQKEKL